MDASANRPGRPDPSLESQSAIPPHSRLSHLIKEEPGVRGCTWFSQYREEPLHRFASIIRLLFHIILAPITAALHILPMIAPIVNFATPFNLSNIQKKLKTPIPYNPDDEEVDLDLELSSAVLKNPPGGWVQAGQGQKHPDVYETVGFQPRWMLKVTTCGGKHADHSQVEWTKELRGGGYIALSYDMEAAFELFKDAGGETQPKPEGKARWTLGDRRRIAEQFLIEYCSATGHSELNREEYIWLDEFCISGDKQEAISDDQLREIRNVELGRLTDIFSGAQTVVVFCHKVGCDHTTSKCGWGNRLFTLSEILHAEKTQQMTREEVQVGSETKKQCHVSPIESGHSFRRRMMHEAAKVNKWHLHSILRHSTNSGADTWQMAIHALIVEAIRRDQESGFPEHNYIGKALNGLLPRRARLADLKGKDGWADLAWLLELNQGFYNTAALAAICCLPSLSNDQQDAARGWLGPPIEPKAGNERLEPLVHAFTTVELEEDRQMVALNFMGAQTIGIHPYIQRDSDALFNNNDARMAKIISTSLLFLGDVSGLVLILINSPVLRGILIRIPVLDIQRPVPVVVGFLLIYLVSIIFNLFRLWKSSQYIEHNGWVFLSEGSWGDGHRGDVAWGNDPRTKLEHLDSTLCDGLREWGDDQLVPKWDLDDSKPPDPTQKLMRGCLVDLRHGVIVRTIVSEPPNSMMVLAIHGCGITYMLLHRLGKTKGVARKVGMASLPPFTLGFTTNIGAMKVATYGDFPQQSESSSSESSSSIGSMVGRGVSRLLDRFDLRTAQ
ncbi:hypothetical protein Moror_5259 [Moniliophthora roreri MCA 2997]|uniref:Heterokaryon incompatibility domain-containing protein n=2 Tax=Moniliophthora roreri TaxID=221103 RepID=V2X5V5_MONRO|nr:hypothetical protein Moror_5259 [Moniliophthora roreri MCA 2997]